MLENDITSVLEETFSIVREQVLWNAYENKKTIKLLTFFVAVRGDVDDRSQAEWSKSLRHRVQQARVSRGFLLFSLMPLNTDQIIPRIAGMCNL